MNELKVIVNQNIGTISFNYEEIKANVAAKMSEYEGAVFTDETMDIAKKEVAGLRKNVKFLSDERIRVKKEFMVPYTEFENMVKEITELIEKPIVLISKQIEEYEENKKQEKKAKIVAIYESLIGDVGEYLPLEKIFDNKWLNVATSIKSITEDIQTVVTSTIQAIQTIKGMNSEAAEKALELYKTNLSLTDAITYINQYEQQKLEILKQAEEKKKADEERQKQAEIDRIRAEERARIAEEERIKEEERKKVLAEEEARKKAEIDAMAVHQEAAGEKIVKASFKVNCYPVELEQIEMYLSSIGVDYERVDA